MTDTSKMRSEFEAWAWREYGQLLWWDLAFDHVFKMVDGKYQTEFLSVRWEAWQASRQSVVVEIKEAAPAPRHSSSYQEGMADGAEAATTAAIEAIQAAGLRCEVKS